MLAKQILTSEIKPDKSKKTCQVYHFLLNSEYFYL